MKILTLFVLTPVAVLGFLSATAKPHVLSESLVNTRLAALHSTGTLGIMTYNVHGLPWPLARGRDSAFSSIERRLKDMRAHSTQPQIVVLQEAFTERAKEVGYNSGYRYSANGPSVSDQGIALAEDIDPDFGASASVLKGETEGKFFDSGLQILSDYPIKSVKKRAFSANACAGYDCLANKGMMMVEVQVPGQPVPLTVVATHMNSKRASGVSVERSMHAYRQQVAEFAEFVGNARNPNFPLVIAGDFNASSDQRRNVLTKTVVENLGAGDNPKPISGMASVLARFVPVPAVARQARYITKRGRDWQFFSPGEGAELSPTGLSIPFGREPDGTMLSDHLGFMIDYRLAKRN
jgi:endonuclease/exonuclease/phosphatase family metal-dependent hydrolase